MSCQKSADDVESSKTCNVHPSSVVSNFCCKNDNNNDEFRGNEKILHIAPMLDVSNREFRQLFRILSKKCVLWTEMVVDETIVHTKDEELEGHLGYDTIEHPVICQIGGNNPEYCGLCTAIILEQYRYDEINLNCECPSYKVSSRREFGAALMKNIPLIYQIIESMEKKARHHAAASASSSSSSNGATTSNKAIVSIKVRIGVDDLDDLDYLVDFIRQLTPVCQKFVLHARKVYLEGLLCTSTNRKGEKNQRPLNPKQNRRIPPLNYPRVYHLCYLFPDCEFTINGGIKDLKAAKSICYGSSATTTHSSSSSGISTAANSKKAMPLEENNTIYNHKSQEQYQNHLSKYHHEYQYHKVPCKICNADSFGSCVVALSETLVPRNLRGCMIGRAAMDNPSIFWDIDRYFYDEANNPCHNRKQVLEEYIKYLERMYPKRCCDNDDRVTFEYPAPRNVIPIENYVCDICGGSSFSINSSSDEVPTNKPLATTSTYSPIEEKSSTSSSSQKEKKHQRKCPGTKISSNIIDRALKPILGMFYGMPCNKKFRKHCHILGRDLKIRNCGPGYILQRAIEESIPDEILSKAFVKTEEL